MNIRGNRTKGTAIAAIGAGAAAAVQDTATYTTIDALGSHLGVYLILLGAGMWFLRSGITNELQALRKDMGLAPKGKNQ